MAGKNLKEHEIEQNDLRQVELKPDELRPDEIDALFQAARSTSPSTSRPEVWARVEPYNFCSAGQISTDQLRAIGTLNGLFARNLTHNLSALLHTPFQVNLISAEQIPFNEFLRRIPEIGYVASMRLEPLGVLSVLQFDLGLVPPIIDLLLGGNGGDGPLNEPARSPVHDPLRELTDIEEAILGSVIENVCRELSIAWQPVGLSFTFDRRQSQTELARIIAVTEKTLCLSFEVHMPNSSGVLNLAFPAVVANTVLRRLITDSITGSNPAPASVPATGLTTGLVHPPRHTGETRSRVTALARRIHFGCTLQLPSVRLAARTLEELKPGDVLRLGAAANTLPEWRVGGVPLLKARAMRHGVHRAARVERPIAGGDA